MTRAAAGWLDTCHVAKASQWCVLNRRLTTLCASQLPPSCLRCFERVLAPEEWLFLSVALQHAHATDIRAVEDDACRNHAGPTFANWNQREQSPEGHRPRTYHALNVDELHALVHGPCWFAQKFAPGCRGLEQLKELLRNDGRASG